MRFRDPLRTTLFLSICSPNNTEEGSPVAVTELFLEEPSRSPPSRVARLPSVFLAAATPLPLGDYDRGPNFVPLDPSPGRAM